MKIGTAKYLILFLFCFLNANFGFTQEKGIAPLKYSIDRIHAPLSISKTQLNAANTLSDLNKFFKASWIRSYISVELMTKHPGVDRKSFSKDEILTKEQKNNLQTIDVTSEISVRIKYIPENTLKQNDPKEINFTFTVDPENEASFVGGEQMMSNYFKENVIDKIGPEVFQGYEFAAIKFTIDEDGKIMNTEVFESSKSEKIDNLILKSICNMPTWKPARYANGTKAKQEFVLLVGNMENCNINLLNIVRL